MDKITRFTDELSERATYEALIGSANPPTVSAMTTMSIFAGALIATGIAYVVAAMLKAHPEVGMPMAIGGIIGFIPSCALVARARSDIFDWMWRVALCPCIGLAIGALVGMAI